MKHDRARETVGRYIEAYNRFDVESMLNFLHNDVVFRNFINGELETETKGIDSFKELAEKSAKIFSTRCMSIGLRTIAKDYT